VLKDVERFGRLLEGSLGIEEPWYIEKVWFDNEAMELHISVGVRKAALIVCPKCGSATSRFGYEKRSGFGGAKHPGKPVMFPPQ